MPIVSRGSHRLRSGGWWTVALLTLLFAGLLVPGGAARSASNAVTFTDPSGDSGGAADITGIELSNDDNGVITLKVGLPNRPTALSLTEVLVIPIDNDPNASDRESFGLGDYALFAFSEGILPMRFDGSLFVPVKAPSLRADYASGLTVSFNRADFGISSRFTFYAQIWGKDGAILDDAANGTAAYTYVVTIGPPLLVAGPVKATPNTPVHGKAFTLRLPVTRTDSNAALPDVGVTVRCTGRVGKKAVGGRGVFAAGNASCTFKVPRASRGKNLKATLTVSHQGATISRSFSSRIR
jgi:hypothetical protein